ncbi:MAG: DedA family protein [Bacteroidaceae bacterium]|nr:DedA family protein [Bacteroidaceae bacterium]
MLDVLLDQLNYWVIFLLMAIESSFIPFPSELVMPPAAWLAATEGNLNIFLVILAGTLGADLGAIINYYLARYLGRPLIYKIADSRFGHLLLITKKKVEDSEVYFEKHGAISTFIGRLVPAVRQLISIPAGLSRMKLSSFLLYTTLGAAIWNTILVGIGYYLSTIESIDSREKVTQAAMTYSHEIGYVIAAIVGLSLLYFLLKKKKQNKKK